MLVLGCVFPVYGMTIVIRSDAGTDPNDLVALVIGEKARFRFSLTRIAVDAAFTLLGWLLCGTAGIGTLIYMFLVGPASTDWSKKPSGPDVRSVQSDRPGLRSRGLWLPASAPRPLFRRPSSEAM